MAQPTINGVKHHGYPFDLSWTGPWWVTHVTLPHTSPLIVLPVAVALLAAVYWGAITVWDRMERPINSANPSRNDRR